MATFKHINYKDDDGYEHVVEVSTTWDLVAQKPETYPPSDHNHDSRYYTETEMDTALALKQDAATAITTGNIATQSVNYAAEAGKATNDQSGNNIKASYASDLTISDHTISLKNKNGAQLASVTVPDNNTWKANSASSEGYVASGAGQANKVWKTDGGGNPAWRDDTNTNTTYSFSAGDGNGQIKVTPSSGAAYNVSVKGLGSLAYSSATIPTNTNQLTNGAGYITGITKKMVTDALGYTPPTTDTNTWRPLGTTADTACAGNDSRLSNARPASDVYAWAKASSKPSYGWTEITGKPSSMPASDVYSWAKASSKPSYSWNEITNKPDIPSSGGMGLPDFSRLLIDLDEGMGGKDGVPDDQGRNVYYTATENCWIFGRLCSNQYNGYWLYLDEVEYIHNGNDDTDVLVYIPMLKGQKITRYKNMGTGHGLKVYGMK